MIKNDKNYRYSPFASFVLRSYPFTSICRIRKSSLRLIDAWTADSPFLLVQRPFDPRCCKLDDLEVVFDVFVFSVRLPPKKK